MKVLITGGAGFIGSHLARKFLRNDFRVVVIDNFSTGSKQNINDLITEPNFKLVTGNVFDKKLVNELVESVDIVFHLAAAVGVKLIVSKPSETIKNNLEGAKVIFSAARKYNKRLIFASTSEVYGKSDSNPFNEDSDLIIGPSSLSRWSYACAKLMDEFLAYSYFQEFGLPVTIVRLFNTVGPYQTGQYGMVIPTFINQAKANLDITIFGNGKQTRCFCSVSDVIEALGKIIDEPSSIGQIINLGSKDEISINELAKKIIDITNSHSKTIKIPYDIAYKPGFEDMLRRVPDISKAERILGWQPKEDLEDIIKSVYTHSEQSEKRV